MRAIDTRASSQMETFVKLLLDSMCTSYAVLLQCGHTANIVRIPRNIDNPEDAILEVRFDTCGKAINVQVELFDLNLTHDKVYTYLEKINQFISEQADALVGSLKTTKKTLVH